MSVRIAVYVAHRRKRSQVATTTYNPNDQWLRKWLRFEPHVTIGGEDDPYLKRWLVIPRNKYANIYLHQFLRSDDDRALHDHPWNWWSFLIKGGYIEHYEGGWRRRSQFSWAHRRPEEGHRVELDIDEAYNDRVVEVPAWTLFITGPKVRDWGFHCGGKVGWRHWEKFTQGGTPTDARAGLGCGES